METTIKTKLVKPENPSGLDFDQMLKRPGVYVPLGNPIIRFVIDTNLALWVNVLGGGVEKPNRETWEHSIFYPVNEEITITFKN